MAAADDLNGISDSPYLQHPSFASSTIQRLYDSTKSLKQFPFAGREGKKPGKPELVVAPLPFLLIYSVEEKAVHILRFLHAAQNRP
jgi:plasmid stabilization system protein ParE